MAITVYNTNVVRLPTAAPRKVQQRFNKHLRAYREANPWPGEYKAPELRAPERVAEGLTRTPELLVCMAMFKALTDDQKREVRDTVYLTAFAFDDEVSASAARLVTRLK